jgi:hypothetical protein
VFDAAAKCPAYVIPDDVADAVRQKQEADQAETAKLIAKGTPVAKLNTGIDGGMNLIFAARVPGGNTGLSEGGDGQALALSGFSKLPGTIPSTVNPPHAPGSDDATVAAAAAPVAAPAPAAAPAPTTRVASAAPNAQSDGLFSSLARKIGLGSAPDTTSTTPPPAPAKPKAADTKPAKVAAAKPAETRQATNRPPFKPAASDAEPAAAPREGLVAGAQPIVQTNSFDSRFSAK